MRKKDSHCENVIKGCKKGNTARLNISKRNGVIYQHNDGWVLLYGDPGRLKYMLTKVIKYMHI